MLLRARHERAIVRFAPLDELLVAREHRVDYLVQDVLGRLAEELRVRVQRLVVLCIESSAMLHELLAARAWFDQWHGALPFRKEVAAAVTFSRRCARRGERPAADPAPCRVDDECEGPCVRTDKTRSRGVSDPLRDSRGAKSGAADAGSLTPRLPSNTDPTVTAGS